jgi:hypothetical protein
LNVELVAVCWCAISVKGGGAPKSVMKVLGYTKSEGRTDDLPCYFYYCPILEDDVVTPSNLEVHTGRGLQPTENTFIGSPTEQSSRSIKKKPPELSVSF